MVIPPPVTFGHTNGLKATPTEDIAMLVWVSHLTVERPDVRPSEEPLPLRRQIPVSEQVGEKSLPVVERKRQTHGRLR